jgi:hypothetical protein
MVPLVTFVALAIAGLRLVIRWRRTRLASEAATRQTVPPQG